MSEPRDKHWHDGDAVATIQAVRDSVRDVVMLNALDSVVAHGVKRGTMRAWLQGHDDKRIGTLQVTRYTAWAPGLRAVETRPSYALFGDPSDGESRSRGDYMRVVSATDTELLATDGHRVALYYVERESVSA